MKRVLILGGTQDANILAAKAALLPNIAVITSFAGRTHRPSLVGQVRIGNFGGILGLIEYLKTQKITGLIDATHPFAAQISWHAAAAAANINIPHLMFVRPAWVSSPGDRWIEVESLKTAAKILPDIARRVFLTIGRQELSTFAHLSNIWFLMRMIEPPTATAPVPSGIVLLERGPFTAAHEQSLFVQYKIEALVSKNSGGSATEAKLDAARALSLPVIMVQRPLMPACIQTSTLEEALQWILDL